MPQENTTWKKDDYLKSNIVAGFIDYIVGLEQKHELEHSYIVKDPRWKKYLCIMLREAQDNTYIMRNDNDVSITIKSMSDAFGKYFWPARVLSDGIDDACTADLVTTSFAYNEVMLERLSSSLCVAISNNDESSTFLQCIEILDWGGVYRGSVRWVLDQHQDNNLITRIKEAVTILDGNTWEPDRSGFIRNNLRMDSGMTKIYALASKKSIIYDDRVGAALGLLVRKYLGSLTPIQNSVPRELMFMRGRTSGRNPTSQGFIFPGRPYNHDPSDRHACSNLLANWVVEAIVDRLNGNEASPTQLTTRREVEAALFVIGYHV